MAEPFSRLRQLRGVVYLSAGVLFCVECIPHVVPTLTRRSCEAPGDDPPEELRRHVHRIAAAMLVPRPDKISVFITSGFSSVCAGHTLLPRGAVVGLPRSVLYRTEEDVRRAGVILFGEHVEWEGQVGVAISQLLLPSASHVNFCIAHEVSHLLHADFLMQSLVAPLSLLLSFHAAVALKDWFPHSPATLVPMVLAASVLVCAMLHRSLNHWQEFRADRRAALCRPSYATGGIEMMRKRMALDRELAAWSEQGTSWYPRRFLSSSFQTHPSFNERLQRLQQLHTVSNSHWGQ